MKHLAMLLIVLLSGCSIFADKEQLLNIRCTPSDSIILLDGRQLACPQTISVPRDKDIHLRITREGHYPYETHIRKTLSGFGIGDAISSAFLLVPAFGLFSSGAYELMQTDFNINLVKIPATQKETL